MKYRLIHLITGLNAGGAEMMLYNLLSKINREKFDVKVISLTDVGPVGEKIKKLRVPVMGLGMKRGVPNPFFLLKLAMILKKEKPDILQTWMYHSDLLGLLAGKLAGTHRIVWGIHHSNLNPESNKKLTIKVAQMCARLSGMTDKIVCCSESSFNVHSKIGYNSEKMVVIPNGFDIGRFLPDVIAKKRLKDELSISENSYIIGLVARWDPLKDHYNFVQAAKIVAVNVPNVHFVLCGDDITTQNKTLISWIKEANVEQSFHLLGRREDVNKIMPAFDLLVSSSKGEAFSNVLGEAMACEVPCVVTDVGDSAYIVGDTGFVVPPEKPDLLAEAIIQFLNLSKNEREHLGKLARERVQNYFSLDLIVKKYEEVYINLLEQN
ncbi:glycosyltransferase family 4 protein [Geobacillus subterraneus]|uniref:glycosyltransferase family 4 protein n=1 Tax=Geobacillus subterraneus TaxID=129338 RepID=UPI001611B64D